MEQIKKNNEAEQTPQTKGLLKETEMKYKEIRLLRHGERKTDSSGKQLDELSEQGILAALEYGARFSDGLPLTMLVSPTQRTVQTGKAIIQSYRGDSSIREFSPIGPELFTGYTLPKSSLNIDLIVSWLKENPGLEGVIDKNMNLFLQQSKVGGRVIGVSHSPIVELSYYVLSNALKEIPNMAGPLGGWRLESSSSTTYEKDRIAWGA